MARRRKIRLGSRAEANGEVHGWSSVPPDRIVQARDRRYAVSLTCRSCGNVFSGTKAALQRPCPLCNEAEVRATFPGELRG